MNQNRDSATRAIQVAATVAAPPHVVMEALTSQALLPLWWAAGWDGCRLTLVQVDPWPGSEFRIEVTEKNGQVATVHGSVVSVTRDLIRFTWKFDDSAGPASIVSVRLVADDQGGTRVEIEHEGVADAERNRTAAFWRRVLTVMTLGVPRLAEMQRSALFDVKTDGPFDAQSIAAYMGRFIPTLMRAISAHAIATAQVVEHIGSPRYSNERGSLQSLSVAVAGQLQVLLLGIDFDIFPPSIGFGRDPEIRVSPTAGSSDVPGATGKIGLQVDVNPSGESRGKIGRLIMDVDLDDRGKPVGAGVSWRCRF